MTTTVDAQVNAEGVRPDAVLDHPGWSGGLDFGLALLRGNVDFLDVGGGARLEWQRFDRAAPEGTNPAAPASASGSSEWGAASESGASESSEVGASESGASESGASESRTSEPLEVPPWLRQRAFLSASARHASQGSRTFANQSFVHARWSAMWHRRVGTDLFAQHQFDELLRLRVRALAGLGARLVLVHRPVFRAWAGTGAMVEHERIRVEEGALDPRRTTVARWTSYLALRLSLADRRLVLQSTTYVQPRFDAIADYRVLNELQLLAVVSTQLASGISLAVWHDRRPPTGVRRTDVRLLASLKIALVSRRAP